MEVAAADVIERIEVAGRAVALLRAGDVEADDAASRQRMAHSATSTDRAAWRIAVTSSFIAIGRPAAAARAPTEPEALEDRLGRLVERQPRSVDSSGAIRTSA